MWRYISDAVLAFVKTSGKIFLWITYSTLVFNKLPLLGWVHSDVVKSQQYAV